MAERSNSAILELPLGRAVQVLAVPAMGAMLLRYANHAVDQFWVGRLPEASTALAAVGAANFLVWGTFSLAALFSTGLQALVARAVGARDPVAQASAIRHGLWFAFALSVAVAAAGLACLEPVLAFQGLSPEVQRLGAEYLQVIFLGQPLVYVGMALGTVFRAEGDTATPFWTALVAVVVNTALDPVFIFGWGPVPALGVRGSAIVTVIASALQLPVLWWVHRRREPLPPAPWDWSQWLRLLRIGYPVAGAGLLFSLVYVAMVKVLSPFGDEPIAALALGHTIEGFPHFVCVGFGQAAATLVGQNLGARRPADAERAAWQIVGWLTLVLAPLALAYGLGAPWLLGLFMKVDDPAVVLYGAQYLRVAAAVQVFGGVEQVLWQALTGAGETRAPTAIDLGVVAARIPLAALLAHRFGLGPLGAWLSIGVLTIAGAVGMMLLFRAGHWKIREI